MDPRRVLFVCYGNICRSPFAAAVFARACAEWSSAPPEVRSAGFLAPNRSSPPEALFAAARLGIDLRPHRSSLLSAEDIRAADLVVVMTPEQARSIRRRLHGSARRVLVLGDLDPQAAQARTITDPWGQVPAVFEESYNRISRCVAELVRLLAPVSR